MNKPAIIAQLLVSRCSVVSSCLICGALLVSDITGDIAEAHYTILVATDLSLEQAQRSSEKVLRWMNNKKSVKSGLENTRLVKLATTNTNSRIHLHDKAQPGSDQII